MTTPTTPAISLPAPETVILRDGSTASLRPPHPDDLPRLEALFARASRLSLWLRFFTPRATVDPALVRQMVDIDGVARMTLLVTRGANSEERVLGVGSYVRLPVWHTADVAFFVDDTCQGLGIGTLLLERLAAHGRRHGVLHLQADVLAENQRMLNVFRHSGLTAGVRSEDGVFKVSLTATPSEAALAEQAARERTATAASLRPFFRPRSVAVLGASREPRGIGRLVFERLLSAGFEGPVYPINPSAKHIASVRAYPSVLDVPDDIDLAVIAVPAARVRAVVDDCIKKRVQALVVLSAGFAETGAEGRARQAELLQTVRAAGLRLVGPNCLGLLNTAADVRLNASFSPLFPPAGRVAMSSQSGALGLALLDYAGDLGLGVSMFVSIGNKADVSSNDLLQYWDEDPDTDVIILYLESFGNPRKFARIAPRVGRRKPILAVKSGRTSAGSRAASSHTAALAGSDTAVAALFQQTGVIRADTLSDLFDVASVLASQPLPAGRRLAVVTNAGGPGILAADAAEAAGLSLPPLAPATLDALRAFLPPAAGLANPIDMIASADAATYERTLRLVLADPNVDAVLVVFIPASFAMPTEVAAALRRVLDEARAAGQPEKPVLACLMTTEPAPDSLRGDASGRRAVPLFRFPEPPVRALARAAAYAEWRARPAGRVVTPGGVDATAARAAAGDALAAHGPGWLGPDDLARLLATAGIALPAQATVATPAEAADAAARLGFPVALKLVSSSITHKSEVGGVVLGLGTPDGVERAAQALRDRLGEQVEGFLVQQMVAEGVEALVGVVDDPTFGPLVGFGLGGTAVEVLRDVAFRITPLTDTDAAETVRAIQGLPLLQGFRGRPPADLAAIEDLLLRVSWLVEEVEAIAELDLNPVRVFADGQGLAVVDARVRLHDGG